MKSLPVLELMIHRLKESKKDRVVLKLEQEWELKCNILKLLDLVLITFMKCKIGNLHFQNKIDRRNLIRMIQGQVNTTSPQQSQACHITIFQFLNWEKANFNKDDCFDFPNNFFFISKFQYYVKFIYFINVY